jgi:small-conductance mechanosensitive channel
MNYWDNFISGQLLSLALPIGLGIAVILLAFLVRRVLFDLLHRWAARTKSEVGDIIIHSTRLASILWCLMAGIYVALEVSEMRPDWVSIGAKVLGALLLLSLALAGADLAGRLIGLYAKRGQVPISVTGLTQTVVRVLVLLLALLILLDSLGVPITSMLAVLGVGSLAVALALQDTLSNLFAGGYVILSKHVTPDDYIKLDSGAEGYVIDIGWRATRLRTLENNVVIVPNSKLAQSIITNYSQPEPKMALLIPISVSYEADPDLVEKVLVEEATEAAQHIPGLLREPEPFVRFTPGFGESSLDFTLICQVREYNDQYLVQHELRKRILRRFRREGIDIPFPVRTVYVKRDHSRADQGKPATT